jgi:hypothetical protein
MFSYWLRYVGVIIIIIIDIIVMYAVLGTYLKLENTTGDV